MDDNANEDTCTHVAQELEGSEAYAVIHPCNESRNFSPSSLFPPSDSAPDGHGWSNVLDVTFGQQQTNTLLANAEISA